MTMSTEVRWIWVTLQGSTFPIGTQAGHVELAPPAWRRFVGSNERFVADYFRQHGATFRPVTLEDTSVLQFLAELAPDSLGMADLGDGHATAVLAAAHLRL